MAPLLVPPSPGETVAVGLGEARALPSGASTGEARLVAFGLGSCVALCLFDPRTGVAGMAHVVLPGVEPTGAASAKYARSALPALTAEMLRAGAGSDPRDWLARLAGGAQVLAIGGSGQLPRIGEQNIAALRQVLEDAHLLIRGEEVGGQRGRTVTFDPREGGLVRVRTIGESERCI